MAEIASESGHWYDQQGAPAYTIIGKNGRPRPTTLQDARKLGLLPSVTTVKQVLAKPGLVNWMIDQALMAALTLPRNDGESLTDFMARAKVDSKKQAQDAAEEGTRIHAAIECALKNCPFEKKYLPHVTAIRVFLDATFPGTEWHSEKSFAHPLGFGGKCDLHSDTVIVDFKSKDFSDPEKVRTYENHDMQLGAYREGLKKQGASGLILFVSRNNPGIVAPCPISTDRLDRGWALFQSALDIWKLQKEYRPEFRRAV